MFDTLSRRGTAAALVASPLIWLASAVVNPGQRSDTADQFDVITAHPGRWTAAAILLVVGTVLLVPGLAAVARVAGPRSPILTFIAVVALGFGAINSVGDCFAQLVGGVLAKNGDRTAMLALADKLDSDPSSGILYAVGGIAFTLGGVLLGIAVARSRRVPVWAGIVVAASTFINIVGWSSANNLLIAASCVPMAVGFAVVARESLSGTRTTAASRDEATAAMGA